MLPLAKFLLGQLVWTLSGVGLNSVGFRVLSGCLSGNMNKQTNEWGIICFLQTETTAHAPVAKSWSRLGCLRSRLRCGASSVFLYLMAEVDAFL